MFSEKRARFELANPRDVGLNHTHLTTLLPLPTKKNLPMKGYEPTTLPLSYIAEQLLAVVSFDLTACG